MKHLNEFFELNRLGVIAHRGFSGLAPENTMAAFQLAIDAGADMIELDVTLSRDGEVVVIHDDTLAATTRGSGRVMDRTLDELRTLDAGSWFAPRFAGERIPVLGEVLALTRDRILLNIEIKPEATSEDVPINIAAKVAALVAERNMRHQVIVSSFSPLALLLMREADPEIMTAALYNSHIQKGQSVRQILSETRAHGFNLSRDEVTPAIAAECRTLGVPVMVYTVNDARTLRRMTTLGVTAVFTDHVEMAVQMLR